jgi:hypothetical protein
MGRLSLVARHEEGGRRGGAPLLRCAGWKEERTDCGRGRVGRDKSISLWQNRRGASVEAMDKYQSRGLGVAMEAAARNLSDDEGRQHNVGQLPCSGPVGLSGGKAGERPGVPCSMMPRDRDTRITAAGRVRGD